MSSKANKKPVLLEEEDIEANMLSNKYQQKTDKQHILDNPDTYIGSVEEIDSDQWIIEGNKIVEKNIKYIPGLFKLFDEGKEQMIAGAVKMFNATKEFSK